MPFHYASIIRSLQLAHPGHLRFALRRGDPRSKRKTQNTCTPKDSDDRIAWSWHFANTRDSSWELQKIAVGGITRPTLFFSTPERVWPAAAMKDEELDGRG